MTWLKVDDGLHGHPKVEQAGAAALGLWVRCGSWASAYLTDGHVPLGIARSFGRNRDADALIAAGLWLPEPGGFAFHDWHDFNPSKQQVLAERAAARARQERRRLNQMALF